MRTDREITIPYSFIVLGLAGIISLLVVGTSNPGNYRIFVISIFFGILLRTKWRNIVFGDNKTHSN